MQYFRVKNIPYCALVDKQGTIAFLGHPKWRKLDQDITALIEGKKLTGRGTKSFKENIEMGWKMAGNDISFSEIEEVKQSYMNLCDTLSKQEEIKTAADSMKSCIVQLIHRTKLDLECNGHDHKMQLEIGLTGTKEQID